MKNREGGKVKLLKINNELLKLLDQWCEFDKYFIRFRNFQYLLTLNQTRVSFEGTKNPFKSGIREKIARM